MVEATMAKFLEEAQESVQTIMKYLQPSGTRLVNITPWS